MIPPRVDPSSGGVGAWPHGWRDRARVLTRAGWRRLRGGQLTPLRAAASVGTGLFIGALPIFGLHLPLCVAVCVPLRLDAPVAYLAANISNPLLAPWIVVAEVQVGALLLRGAPVAFDVAGARATGIAGFVSCAAAGALVVGMGLALVGGLLAGGCAHLCRRSTWKRRRTDGRCG